MVCSTEMLVAASKAKHPEIPTPFPGITVQAGLGVPRVYRDPVALVADTAQAALVVRSLQAFRKVAPPPSPEGLLQEVNVCGRRKRVEPYSFSFGRGERIQKL